MERYILLVGVYECFILLISTVLRVLRVLPGEEIDCYTLLMHLPQ